MMLPSMVFIPADYTPHVLDPKEGMVPNREASQRVLILQWLCTADLAKASAIVVKKNGTPIKVALYELSGLEVPGWATDGKPDEKKPVKKSWW